MSEQNGNSKPNEAEGLAFPLPDNEKLIEEAAKAIHDVAMREYPGMPADIYGWDVQKDHDRDVYLLEARAALAVFEKAHTTTPPDGWFYMGSHVGAPWLNLEFSEEMDETGLPLWERPVQHTPTDDEPEALRIAELDARQAAYRKEREDWFVDHEAEPEIATNAFFRGWDAAVGGGFRRAEVVPEPSTCLIEHPITGTRCSLPAEPRHAHVCDLPAEPQGEPSDAQAERARIIADLREWSRPLGHSPEEETLRLVIDRIERAGAGVVGQEGEQR